jgi:hypothetical protein
VLINREAEMNEQGWPEHEHKLSVKANKKARLSTSSSSNLALQGIVVCWDSDVFVGVNRETA